MSFTPNEAITNADRLLPGHAAPEGETDPRWQAIMVVADFIPTHPDEVWEFAARWGTSEDSDLRDAIATCVLEHLLEHHFDLVFPRVSSLAQSNANFAATRKMCWRFGQAELPQNARRLDDLEALLQ